MKILVDADACPVVRIVEQVARQYHIKVILLCDTNHVLTSDYSEVKVIGAGADAVDFALVNLCKCGDLVVTQDYGVAAMALGKGAYGIHQSGRWYTNENIDQLLMERHMAKKARMAKSKHHLKGPSKRTEEDDKRFKESFEKLVQMVNKSLLKTTQNTRDLGGYKMKSGNVTKYHSLIRSDVQNYPCEEDFKYLIEHDITTVIDLRGQKDVEKKPSGFANVEGISYYNFQIDEGSGVPESTEAVPRSYMDIACAKAMPEVFRCIANAPSGVMYNCTAGKDRTGVVSAILLSHAGVSDRDIVENYVLTREYGRERLELIHKNFPEIDMNIVTPNEKYMEEFLKLFREKFGDTKNYIKELGLNDVEIKRIAEKLVEERDT